MQVQTSNDAQSWMVKILKKNLIKLFILLFLYFFNLHKIIPQVQAGRRNTNRERWRHPDRR